MTLSSVMQTNCTAMDESAAASEEHSSQASRLPGLFSEFQLVETDHSDESEMPQDP